MKAQQRGNVYKGRRPKLTDEQIRVLAQRLDAGETATKLAREYGIGLSTVHALRKRAADRLGMPLPQLVRRRTA